MTELADLSDLMPDAAAVTTWWQRHGLPGLFDVHVHFMAPPVQRAVWEVFDTAGPKLGRPWPVRYRLSDEDRIELLRAMGIRRFSALSYAHRPGIAEFLNGWARDFAERVPESLWSATLYPETTAAAYVAELVEAGVEVFKVHVQVGDFLLDDPLLEDVWGTLSDARTPVLIHAGSGPVASPYTGPASLRRVLARFPELTVIVAHLGAPEYGDFLELAERYERVHLDTTMVFTDFFSEATAAYPTELLPRLQALGEKVLLGTDYPSIPYPYLHQLEALERLELGEHWLRSVCWDNGARLFGETR